MSTSPQARVWTRATRSRRSQGAQPLWHRLLLLAIAAMVPLALIAGTGAAVLLMQQRADVERATLQFTRAFANAIEAELGRSAAVLSVLASSAVLERGDAQAFRELSLRVLATLPDWRAVVLTDSTGRVVSHTGFADPADAPPLVELESLRRAVTDRKPTVGRLLKGPGGEWGVPIRYPVLLEGDVIYVLSGVLKPEAVLRVVQRQRVPDDWLVSVFDAGEARIARSRGHDAAVGGPPSQSLHDLMSSGAPEGSGVAFLLEGDRVYTAFVRLPDTGWTVSAGRSTAAFEADLQKAVLVYGGAIVFSLLLAALLAWLFAKRINRPIAELREAARSLGRGELPEPPHPDIVEVNDVAQALLEAARERARSEAEREALLAAERKARAAAEAARHRLELLAGSGSLLSRSLESAATLEAVAKTVVPDIADWCNIDLTDERGHLQRALIYHSDAKRRERLQTVLQRLRPKATMEGSMAWAAKTGQSFHARFPTAEALERVPDADFRELAKEIGMRVHFVVPLIARGRTVGAMAVAQAESGRELELDDRALLTELAQRSALAIDNARLYAQAEGARAQAESANRAKDEFLAMLGHELRNPLAPIVTALQLMKMRHATVAERERGIIDRQVRHLSRLVDDLLDVSRIARGKVQLERHRLDLREVVDKAIELTAPASGERAPIQMHLPAAPVHVDGDEVRLVQVVCNLLSNALKFTPPPGTIRLSLAAQGDEAVVSVADQGAGIAPELLPHVFDLFVQGEQALDRRGGGLGLGLGIVKAMVRLHGGTVVAESAGPGQGSRFTVRLPLAEEPTGEPGTPPDGTEGNAGRVLVVDDNVDAAHSLSVLLNATGYEVREVHDGPAALAALEQFIPDIALLDIGLPGMNGYELAEALRKDPRLEGLVIIAITGYGRDHDRDRALEGGFDEHLVKPVEIDALLRLLKQRVKQR